MRVFLIDANQIVPIRPRLFQSRIFRGVKQILALIFHKRIELVYPCNLNPHIIDEAIPHISGGTAPYERIDLLSIGIFEIPLGNRLG